MPKIDSIRGMGLRKYLNSTTAEHNGRKYRDLADFLTLAKPPSVASMARIFNVGDQTMRKWIGIYKEEAKK